MFCIAMTGCISTTPRATLELLLDLFPPSIHIEPDKLARNGFSISFAGPEPAIGISSNLIRNIVFDIGEKSNI